MNIPTQGSAFDPTRPARSSSAAWLALLAVLGSACAANAAVLRVGSPVGPGQCTHATIQAAIDAAAASPGLDIIRVTRGDYLAQRLTIIDSGDLAIEGGFLECATLVRVDHSTFDGQGANPPGPVIRHTGSGRLTLSDLTIRNGVAFGAGSTTTFGGGISSSTAATLTVSRSLIHSNRARSGGGMFVSAPVGEQKDVILAGVGFSNNEAVESGGGLYASSANVQVTSDDPNYFGGNRSLGTTADQGGGAAFLVNSSFFVNGRLPASSAFMDGNTAQSNGGAIFFASLTAGSRTLSIRNHDAGVPATLAYNTAARFGGAVYVRATASGAPNSASAMLINTIVSDNRAPQGSAFYLYGGGNDNDNQAQLSMEASRVGDASPPCPASLRCNRVDRNVSNAGATIELEEGGTRGVTSIYLKGGHFVDNIAIAGGGLVFGSGHVHVDNSVLANNDAGSASLIDIAGGNEVRVQNSTIAGNTRVAPALFTLISANDDLTLHNSIAFQPGVVMLQVAAGAGIALRNLLVGSGHGLVNLAERNIQDQLNPLFANPGQGDFQLQPGSQARNRWSPGGGVNVPSIDLLGALRPAPPDGPTPYDFGAYEYGAVVDPIFNDTFDRN